MKRTVPTLLLSALAASLCLAAQAAEPEVPTPNATETTFAGVKVGIDAETGKLRPLSETESRQLDQALTHGKKSQLPPGLARSFAAPANEAAARATVRSLPGSGVAVKLPQSQMSTVSAHRDASGQLSINHGDDASEGLPNE